LNSSQSQNRTYVVQCCVKFSSHCLNDCWGCALNWSLATSNLNPFETRGSFFEKVISTQKILMPLTLKKYIEPPFYICSLHEHDRNIVAVQLKKWPKMPIFFTTRKCFVGFRWSILTNDTVLKRLLNFWSFRTYFTIIAHPGRIRKPPKIKSIKLEWSENLTW